MIQKLFNVVQTLLWILIFSSIITASLSLNIFWFSECFLAAPYSSLCLQVELFFCSVKLKHFWVVDSQKGNNLCVLESQHHEWFWLLILQNEKSLKLNFVKLSFMSLYSILEKKESAIYTECWIMIFVLFRLSDNLFFNCYLSLITVVFCAIGFKQNNAIFLAFIQNSLSPSKDMIPAALRTKHKYPGPVEMCPRDESFLNTTF